MQRLLKLNLSFYSLLLLLLLFGRSSPASGQRTVQVYFEDGKPVQTSSAGHRPGTGAGNIPFFAERPMTGSAGSQRTYIVNGAITLTITTIQPSCGDYNGAIIVSASGGTPPYTFTRDNLFFFNTGNFANVAAGNYTILVTDATGQTATANVTLTNTLPPLQLTAVSATRPVSCTGTNGAVTLSASGGVPPYEYSIDLVNFQSSGTYSNLAAGLYNFYARDANGCLAKYSSLSISQLLNPSGCNLNGGGFEYTDQECNNDGHINANGGGVNAPHTYSLDGINYQSSGSFNNLGYGVYNVYIKNVLGDVRITAIAIRHNCQIDLDFITIDAACQQSDGALTINATNGTAPYTYTIDGVNYQTPNVFTNLAPGNYYATVRDAQGYTSSRGVTLYDRCPAVTLTATGETCLRNDGAITAYAAKGTEPYQYSIDGVNFQTSNIFNGLAAGSYTVTLKDALGFTDVKTITVNNVCLAVMVAGVNATCGNNNAKITATAGMGASPYQYSIDGVNFQSSGVFTGLAAGAYTVTAKDINGRTGTATITLSDIAGPQVTAAALPAFCGDNDGAITISGTGGALPFQFSINGSSYVSNGNFAALSSGAYTAWIKDANGCLASQPVTVPLNCPVVETVSIDETCGAANGSITASGSAGTPPYQYSMDGSNFQSGGVFPGLAAGDYTVHIKDAAGAVNTVTVTLVNICPTVTTTVTNGLCGNANASLTAAGANGTPPYAYSIDGVNFQSSATFTGLATGFYTITVRDVNGLTNTAVADVQNFPGPQISISSTPASCLGNDGIITAVASGGTAPLRYSLDGTSYQDNPVFNGIASGFYSAWVADANGCAVSGTVAVDMTDNLVLTAPPDISICEGLSTGLNASSNGTGFSWSPTGGLSHFDQAAVVASPSANTKYYVSATLGICRAIDSVIVFVIPAPVANAGKDSTICFGQSIQLAGSGGELYEWTPATYLDNAYIGNPVVASPVNSITYMLQVTDVNGCKSLHSASITISVTPPAEVFAGSDTSIVINQPFVLYAADVNASGFVDYTWSPPYGLNNSNIQSPVAVLDRDIVYTVTATTEKGCRGSDEVAIKVYKGPDIYVPGAFSPNNDGLNDVLKAIPVGIKEFRYFMVYNRWGQRVFFTADPSRGWDGGVAGSPQNNDTFVWLAEGIDDNGKKVQRKGTVTIVR